MLIKRKWIMGATQSSANTSESRTTPKNTKSHKSDDSIVHTTYEQSKKAPALLPKAITSSSSVFVDSDTPPPLPPRATKPLSEVERQQKVQELIRKGLIEERNNQDNNAALEYFAQAVEIDPNSDITHMHKGRILKFLGHVEDGLRELSIALSINPNNFRARWCFDTEDNLPLENEILKKTSVSIDDFYTQAKIYYIHGNLDNALERYLMVYKIEPTYPTLAETIGNIYLQIENCAEAYKFYRYASELAPNDALVWYSQGLALFHLIVHSGYTESLEQVIKCYTRAIDLRSNDILFHCMRAQAYCHIGGLENEKLAAADLKIVSELYKDISNRTDLSAGNIRAIELIFGAHKSLIEQFSELAGQEIQSLDMSKISSADHTKAQRMNEEIEAANALKSKWLTEASSVFNVNSGAEDLYVSTQEIKMQMMMNMVLGMREEIAVLKREKANVSEVSYAVKMNARYESDASSLSIIKSDVRFSEYHVAFTKTLNTAHHVAMGLAGGGAMDTSNMVSTASNLISLIPLPGSSAVAAIASKAGEMWTAKKMLEHAKKLTAIPSTTEFENLVFHVSMKMTLNPKTCEVVEHSNDKDGRAWYSSIIDLCTKLKTTIDKTLYAKGYDSDWGRQGDKDARKIIDAIYSNKLHLNDSTISDDMVNLLLIGDSEAVEY
jgi:tetratricopeptide (TPR) repeat protein